MESKQDQEREDLVNKSVVDIPDIESNKSKSIKPIRDTSKSEYFLKNLEYNKAVQEGFMAGYREATLEESERAYNQRTIDETKERQFKKLLSKSAVENKKKPKIICDVFVENKIYHPSQGWTLTEMAFMCREHFYKNKSNPIENKNIPIEKMKNRVKSWISDANERYDARIHPTELEKGVFRYHIAKRNKDVNSQINKLDEFKTNIGVAEDKRKSLAEQLKKEQEQEQKEKIVIDTEGKPVQAGGEI